MTPNIETISVDQKDLQTLDDAGIKKADIAKMVHSLAFDIRSKGQAKKPNSGKGLTASEIEVLRDGGALGLDASEDDLRDARIQSVMRMTLEMKKVQADSLDTASVAKLLTISPARVRQLINPSRRGLYHFKSPDGKARFPSWQFDDGSTIPGLRSLLKELNPEAHPISVCRLMTDISTDLFSDDMDDYLTPRDWLKTRHPLEPVLTLIRDL